MSWTEKGLNPDHGPTAADIHPVTNARASMMMTTTSRISLTTIGMGRVLRREGLIPHLPRLLVILTMVINELDTYNSVCSSPQSTVDLLSLPYLWVNHESTVHRHRVPTEIVLMVFLGGMENIELLHFCNSRRIVLTR